MSYNAWNYTNGNPVNLTDPTGRWSEEELRSTLGKNWEEEYFGKKAVFEGKEEFLKFLRSDQTGGWLELEVVHNLMTPARAMHGAGIGFDNVDAIGARLAISGGTALFGSLSFDTVLNFRAGQLSLFISPEGGFIIGESGNATGGITVIRELPSNDNFRGTFMSLGIQGGHLVGVTGEAFWSSPMSNRYCPSDKTNGGFLGVGPAITGIGGSIIEYEVRLG